ncbi:MAG: protein-methionine-sulfoxide reductase heme-binding subunit MsrQ [Paracoccaceae bacterium]
MTIAQSINGALRRVPAWPIYILGVLPGVWDFYQGLTGGLGAEPIKALEHELGRFALQLFIVVLAITPLRNYTKINLIKYRRALGLMVFFYVSVHLAVWMFLDVQDIGAVWKDIVKRPYITIGMAGFAALVPLAITSNNRSLRRLGPLVWRKLHLLTYPAVLLGGVHFVWLRKGWQVEPMLYLLVIVVLLVLRLKFRKSKSAVGAS